MPITNLRTRAVNMLQAPRNLNPALPLATPLCRVLCCHTNAFICKCDRSLCFGLKMSTAPRPHSARFWKILPRTSRTACRLKALSRARAGWTFIQWWSLQNEETFRKLLSWMTTVVFLIYPRDLPAFSRCLWAKIRR